MRGTGKSFFFFFLGERWASIDGERPRLCALSSVLFPARSLESRHETAIENSLTTSDMAKRKEKEGKKRDSLSFASSDRW